MNYKFQTYCRSLLFVWLLTLLSAPSLFANDDVVRAIILIDRQAELVDMNTEGEIIARYMEVPDYFSPRKSHKRSLRESLNRLKELGATEDHSLPGASNLASVELQSYMQSLTTMDDAQIDHMEQDQQNILTCLTTEDVTSINRQQAMDRYTGIPGRALLVEQHSCSKSIKSSIPPKWAYDQRQQIQHWRRSIKVSQARYLKPFGRTTCV